MELESHINSDDRFEYCDVLLDAGATYASERTRLNQAERLARRAVDIAVQYGRRDNIYLTFADRLGHVLVRNLKLEDALRTFDKMKEIALDETCPSKNLLFKIEQARANIFKQLSLFSEAAEAYRIAEELLPQDMPQLRISLVNGMGDLQFIQRDFKGALHSASKNLALVRAEFGPDHQKRPKQCLI